MEFWKDGILGFCIALLKKLRSIKDVHGEVVIIDPKTLA
jgi:hypothetical protein